MLWIPPARPSATSPHQFIAAASGVYTLDAAISNEFTANAAVAGNITITASNLSCIPFGHVWRCVFRFAYTSGAVTFAAPAGFVVKVPAATQALTAGRTYDVIARALGADTVIDFRYGGDGFTT
jgi:hypothetical protein